MSKRKRYDPDEPEVDQPEDAEPEAEVQPIPPGSNEPNTPPPSIVGTEQDPNRKPAEET